LEEDRQHAACDGMRHAESYDPGWLMRFLTSQPFVPNNIEANIARHALRVGRRGGKQRFGRKLEKHSRTARKRAGFGARSAFGLESGNYFRFRANVRLQLVYPTG
jgi:hypothetical protein